ncbi:hypothetical protein [Domibacillus robiginosus]|uniref:hypothetical protein n=1 Tax=Domibacillus robiginosus TaxID=1071054 RepID=UPI0012E0127E|nr:hypothetical protein [Domibacillus robiginosus]
MCEQSLSLLKKEPTSEAGRTSRSSGSAEVPSAATAGSPGSLYFQQESSSDRLR